MPPHFFQNFSNSSENFVETNRMSERFYGGSSILQKSKDDMLHGMKSCYLFKAPSSNAPAAMARRLASTSLIPVFHPISFYRLFE
jgi:hypothetical protein